MRNMLVAIFLASCALPQVKPEPAAKTEPYLTEKTVGSGNSHVGNFFSSPVTKVAEVINPLDTPIKAQVECVVQFDDWVRVEARSSQFILFTTTLRKQYDENCRIVDWKVAR